MNVEELFDILLSDKPSEGLLQNEGELFDLIPELKSCKGFNQNSKWHIYDVYEHTLHVVDGVPPQLIIRLAALFHDIGKPLSYTEDEQGQGHFYGHWEKSLKIFEDFAARQNLDRNISEMVSHLIYFHDSNVSQLKNKNLKMVRELLGENGIDMLYQLKRADLLAQSEQYHYLLDDYENQRTTILKRFKELDKEQYER